MNTVARTTSRHSKLYCRSTFSSPTFENTSTLSHLTIMIEIDSHFNAYEHLKDLPREQEALHALRKAASLVKPIMRKRGWKVGTLCEFLPPDSRLQGMSPLLATYSSMAK